MKWEKMLWRRAKNGWIDGGSRDNDRIVSGVCKAYKRGKEEVGSEE